jgi:cobyrinic acid a,c-diamide synthase
MNMKYHIPRIVIAGLKGGSGKTTLTAGLLRLWRDKGRAVAAFKKGPDYIDAGWLSAASGRACYNLDTFIIPEERLMASFLGRSGGADAAVIEGNRGLFDGMDFKGTYSTAELAKLLSCPVILVVDCKKTTTTIGVIVKGVREFDAALNLKGVVLNYTANARQEGVIRQAVEDFSGVPVLGAMRSGHDKLLPERHMGLVAGAEYGALEAASGGMAAFVAAHVDDRSIWQAAQSAPAIEYEALEADADAPPSVRVGVIRDSAFQFYYPENIEALERAGAAIVGISAVTDASLPDIDALYIGGGFPETNAIRLSENKAFREDLRARIETGLPVYAECGGLMFLGEKIITDGAEYPMTGVFPIAFKMEPRPAAHGYTVAEVEGENPYFERGATFRGHEFHYSRPVGIGPEGAALTPGVAPPTASGALKFAFRMTRGKGIFQGLDGVIYKNVLAAYTHLHALGAGQWAPGIVRAAACYKNLKAAKI